MNYLSPWWQCDLQFSKRIVFGFVLEDGDGVKKMRLASPVGLSGMSGSHFSGFWLEAASCNLCLCISKTEPQTNEKGYAKPSLRASVVEPTKTFTLSLPHGPRNNAYKGVKRKTEGAHKHQAHQPETRLGMGMGTRGEKVKEGHASTGQEE